MYAYADFSGLAVVALIALLCGMAMARLKQSPVAGYIVVGVLLGPTAFALVENRDQIAVLAELGVLMLLFVVGMRLSLRAFLAMWRFALIAVGLQLAACVTLVLAASAVFGLSLELAVLLGLAGALSSTAVAIKMLEETGQRRTRIGRITAGILVAQSLAFVPALLIVDNFARGAFGFGTLIRIGLALALLGLLVRILSRRGGADLPFIHIVEGNDHLLPLTAIVFALGAAALAGIVGLTSAYGAFLAGLVIGNSAQRTPMLARARPIEGALMMAFFLSIGLLIDLGFIIGNLGTVLILVVIVLGLKTAINAVILKLLGETWQRALLYSATVAQLGEFSFLLAAFGLVGGGVMAETGERLVVSVIVVSLALGPFWTVAARRLHALTTRPEAPPGELLEAIFGREADAIIAGAVHAAALARGALRRSGRPERPRDSDDGAAFPAAAADVKQPPVTEKIEAEIAFPDPHEIDIPEPHEPEPALPEQVETNLEPMPKPPSGPLSEPWPKPKREVISEAGPEPVAPETPPPTPATTSANTPPIVPPIVRAGAPWVGGLKIWLDTMGESEQIEETDDEAALAEIAQQVREAAGLPNEAARHREPRNGSEGNGVPPAPRRAVGGR